MKQPTTTSLHRITIVGGGAGGLELAVRLGNKLGKKGKAEIILVDAARTHVWKPLLHQVAAGTLVGREDETEYLALARRNHFHFRLGRMEGLNRPRKEIRLAPMYDEQGQEVLPAQIIPYDTLVFALGSQTNDFGTPGVHEHSIMLDSSEAAERLHRRLVNACLRAQAKPRMPGDGCFTITIIGGGPTGVELSAELHRTARILSNYGAANFDPGKDIRIVLIEAAPRLLQALPEKLSGAVAHELKDLDIEVIANTRVVEIDCNGVHLASGDFIPSSIVVWAAGIKIPDFLKDIDGLETNRINQLVVERTMQATRDPDIFAIGDCAAIPHGESGTPVPARAQAAHQEAATLAKSLVCRLEGKPVIEFTYRDRGSLISIAGYSAVGSLMGAISRRAIFVEGKFAKWMYWCLHKHHQVVVNGFFRTWLGTWGEMIHSARNPGTKLH